MIQKFDCCKLQHTLNNSNYVQDECRLDHNDHIETFVRFIKNTHIKIFPKVHKVRLLSTNISEFSVDHEQICEREQLNRGVSELSRRVCSLLSLNKLQYIKILRVLQNTIAS